MKCFRRKQANLGPQTVYTVSAHFNQAFQRESAESLPGQDHSIYPTAHAERGDVSSVLQENGEINEIQVEIEKPKKIAMKRTLSIVHCIGILMAVTGHAAIFISPAAIFKNAGSVGAALVSWLLGGLINFTLALCYVELGTMMPKAGGPYFYVMKTLGPLSGFVILWGFIALLAPPLWAFLSYTAALYIVKPVFPDCHTNDVELAVKVLAGWILISLVALNCAYMKYVTKVQTFLSCTKMAALLIIAVGGIFMLVQGKTENFENPFEDTSHNVGDLALSVMYSSFSYVSWQMITVVMEEVKDPGKTLPRSIYITFPVVIAMYIMVNVSYFTLLSTDEVVESRAVAMLFIERLYSPLVPLMSVLVATTCIAALNGSIMVYPRLLFAASRVGHMPTLMGMIHIKYLTPWPATFLMLAVAFIMLYSGTVQTIMNFISVFAFLTSIAIVLALLYLRWKEPDTPRPYKTFLMVPVFQLIVNFALLILVLYHKPREIGIGIGLMFAGIPVYWVGVLWRNKPTEFTEMIERWTIIIQKLFHVVKSS